MVNQEAMVSFQQDGVPPGMPGAQQGDAGGTGMGSAEEARLDRLFQERMSKAIEDVASGFRSTIDRRLGNIERVAQQFPQYNQRLDHMTQKIDAVDRFLQQAQDSALEPEERQSRAQGRQVQDAQRQAAEATTIARQYAAQLAVRDALVDGAVAYGDQEVDWRPDLFAVNPEQWSATVIAAAARVSNGRIRLQMQAEQERNRANVLTQAEIDRQRQAQLNQREQVTAQNFARNQDQAAFESAIPNGTPPDVFGKIEQMSPKERQEYITAMQKKVVSGKIRTTSQMGR